MATSRAKTEEKKARERPDKEQEDPGGTHADSPVQDDKDRDIPTGTSGPSLGGTSLSPSPPEEDTEEAIDETHHDKKKQKKTRDD